MSELPLPGKIAALDAALAEVGISHAFGGALALAYYAEPRATIDIDVNLFVTPSAHPRVATALAGLGVDAAIDEDALAREGQCRVWWGRTPLDLFYAYDEVHERMRERARRVPFAEGEIPILSPEHLIVCKVAYDRAKDWIDIEQMLAFVDHLDVAEVESQLARLLGESDPRAARFHELRASAGGA